MKTLGAKLSAVRLEFAKNEIEQLANRAATKVLSNPMVRIALDEAAGECGVNLHTLRALRLSDNDKAKKLGREGRHYRDGLI